MKTRAAKPKPRKFDPLPIDRACEVWLALHRASRKEPEFYTGDSEPQLSPVELALYEALTKQIRQAATTRIAMDAILCIAKT